jgi:topoisomerase-4 subunit B
MAALGLTAEMGVDGEALATPAINETDDLVERLMGKNADARFQFIQQNAEFVQDVDV